MSSRIDSLILKNILEDCHQKNPQNNKKVKVCVCVREREAVFGFAV